MFKKFFKKSVLGKKAVFYSSMDQKYIGGIIIDIATEGYVIAVKGGWQHIIDPAKVKIIEK